MSIINLLFFFSFLFSLNLTSSQPLIDISKPEKIEGAEFLLTYPRSGTNWVMTLLQILIKKPVRNANNPTKSTGLVLNRLNLPIDENKSILYRTHRVTTYLRKINPTKNKLLLVLRNYKECIVRQEKCTPESFFSIIIENKNPLIHYLDNLIFFDQWKDKNTKLLIYYEDLIHKPYETIEKLLVFFEERSVNVEDFFANYDHWKNQCLFSYIEQTSEDLNKNGHTSSNGDKEVFHSKDFSPEIIQAADRHISKNYPELWKKYLKKYKS